MNNGQSLELMVTLWPSFPHFQCFAEDKRVKGIRLNSAMMSHPELEKELGIVAPRLARDELLYFDVKGRQLRVVETHVFPDHLELTLNHRIEVATPTVVLFKAGADECLLEKVEDGGRRLVFRGGPYYEVRAGESLHLRDPSLRVHPPVYTDAELQKIERVRRAGFKRYFLSYVEEPADLDQFLELVGKDAEVMLKIESKRGLDYVANAFRKRDNVSLVAACGDLYVELERPHEILQAVELILEKDPQAVVGSRMLLSVIHDPVPSYADFAQLAWLERIGYRRFMLCDELCLKGELLATAVNAFEAFRSSYAMNNS